ncbi:MAG: glycosyltransferase family 4 protein [Bacteroidetes bacterium]|nr:glycosyltransferase family 4 protein [Bacteroidota bacterium]MBL6944431.1 glycosyltransferase family 4 protein [Bacteroidales bacterium]
MNILMVLEHEFPPDIRVENEIEALTGAGHQVHIACTTMKNKPIEDTYQKATIHRKPISKFIHKTSVGALSFPFYFNFWRSFLRKLFKKYNFNAIHIHDLPLARVGYEFAKKHEAKITLDLHENWPALLSISTHTQTILGKLLSNNNHWVKYERKYCQLTDNVIVVADEAKKRLVDLFIDPKKIIIVSNTLNLKGFEIPESSPDPEFITLLYAGGINKHRGLQYVIQGVKLLEGLNKKLRVWVLGTGSYINELKKIAEIAGVEDKIFFEGWKNYTEMQTYSGKSNYCLIPHLKNDHTDSTIPHKIFQYMYAGKPMLVSDCEPLKRIVEETKSGLVYKFDCPEDFACKLKELVKNDWYSSVEFVNNNKNIIIEKYNWDEESVKLLKIYS